jgi:glucose/arabinose dehydrogenase
VRRASTTAVALALALVAAACGSGKSTPPAASGATTPTSGEGAAASTGPGADPAAVKATLVKVADVRSPTAMAVRRDDDAVYVAEKTGRVRVIPKGQTAKPAAPDPNPVLDLSGQVSTGSEQGLLGLAFSADGGKLYVDYTDTSGNSQVVEYGFANGRADPASRRVVLTVDQPFANHNGGEVVFGPDGKLYVGLGDGGSEGDPANRGQNLGILLAKILRIDPTPANGKGYTVPADNPFVGRSGVAPETWMYGLRNPWRFSWDRTTHDLWIADVGQDKYEEIDFLPAGSPAGANFGWSLMEASHSYKGANPPGGILPIFEYSHADTGGCSVTGGYVYRGTNVPTLRGVYVYGDACSGAVWGLTQQGGKVVKQAELNLGGDSMKTSGYSISSFGEDGAGELYLLNLAGAVYRFEAA